MTDNKNTILAIVLSAVVLIAWQFFFAMPQEKARQEKLQAEQLAQKQQQTQTQTPAQPGQPAQAPAQPGRRAGARASGANARRRGRQPRRGAGVSPRVPIETDSLQGSIALKGGRIDDLALIKFRETVDPKSPPIVLLSPSGSPDPFYAEFGWTNAAGANVKVPDRRHAVDAKRLRRARRRPSGDADLRQRRGPRIPPHHRGRRQISVHHQGRGGQQDRQAGLAVSLRADLAPRHAADARLLHSARRPDRQVRRRGLAGSHLQEDRGKEDHHLQRHQRVARHHRQILGGGAAAQDRRPCDGEFPRRQARHAEDLSDRLPARRAHHRAGRQHRPRMRGCSPAPRKCASSTATRSNSTSTTSIC